MKFVCAAFLFSACLLMVGCGPNSGKGIPKLYPLRVKVESDGVAVPRVSVMLSGGAEGLVMGGKTDETGTAVISTKRSSFVGQGVPKGEYKIVLNESGPETRSLSISEKESMSEAEQKAFSKEAALSRKNWKSQVPKNLMDSDKTPLSASVSGSDENVVTINLKEYAQ